MSGGQQEAQMNETALNACDDVVDALYTLKKTAAFDAIFGLHPEIVYEINKALKSLGLELRKASK